MRSWGNTNDPRGDTGRPGTPTRGRLDSRGCVYHSVTKRVSAVSAARRERVGFTTRYRTEGWVV
jgi:hypothetical protein